MKKGISPLMGMLVGVLIFAAGAALLIHDMTYILTGQTVDLNQILRDGEELPRGKYVTYICYTSLGNYAETTTRYGFISLPGKTQQFAFLGEDNRIMSAEIGKKSTIQAMNEQAGDYFSGDETQPVVLTGCFEINRAGMDRFLTDYFEGTGYEEEGILLTSYAINTTKTRLKITLLYLAALALGAACLVASLGKLVAGRARSR